MVVLGIVDEALPGEQTALEAAGLGFQTESRTNFQTDRLLDWSQVHLEQSGTANGKFNTAHYALAAPEA